MALTDLEVRMTRNSAAHGTDGAPASAETALKSRFETSVGSILCSQAPATEREKRFIGYFRVSTDKQGRSGLGLDAQRHAVSAYIDQQRGRLVADFTEIETGKRNDRPMLAEAMAVCRRERATLIIAKLDRLARNVAFIANLMEASVPFIAADMPHAERLTLHIFAAMAEEEARRISQRTKAALAAAKARGTVLGAYCKTLAEKERREADERARALAPMIAELRVGGATTDRALTAALNERGVVGPRGGRFHLRSVQRLRKRIAGLLLSDAGSMMLEPRTV